MTGHGRGSTVLWGALLSVVALQAAQADDAPQPLWAQTAGGSERDESDGIAIDRQGAVVTGGVFRGSAEFSGQTITSRGEGDVFVAKYSPRGRLKWLERFGSRGEDNAFDLCTDGESNVILSGWFGKTLRLGSHTLTSAGGQDGFIAKLDPQGKVLWAQRFGGPGEDGGNEVTVDATGAIVVTATSDGEFSVGGRTFRNGGGQDAYVFKLAPLGQLEWAKQVAGAGEARVRAVGTDGWGRVLAGFQFTQEARLGRRTFTSRGSWDGLAVSWSSDGRQEQVLQLGGAGYDMVRGIGGDGQGNAYVSGGFAGRCTLAGRDVVSRDDQDDYLLKLNPRGEAEWIVQISGGEDDHGTTGGAELVVSEGGAVYLSTKLSGRTRIEGPMGRAHVRPTSTERSACLIAFDARGALRWTQQPTSSEYSTGGPLAISPDGVQVAQAIYFRGRLEVAGETFQTRGGSADKDFAIALSAVAGTPKVGALPPKPAWQVDRDRVYLPGVSPRKEVSLDVYSPARGVRPLSPAGHPVLVMVHGGGWTIGDKGNRKVWEAKARHWVARGWVFVSVNYRLAPTVQHPTQVQDVAAALAWVHGHADRYGGDRSQLYAMGHSAGAHLVALAATDARHLRQAGKRLTILRGVICLDTSAYDLPTSAASGGPQTADIYATAFGPSTNWADASPINHVSAGKGIPSFLCFYVGRRLGARTITNAFAQTLSGAGVQADVIHAPDRDHEGINAMLGTVGDPYTAHVDAFLARERGVR